MQVLSLSVGQYGVLVPVNMVAQIVGSVSVESTDRFADTEVTGILGTIKWREFEVPLLQSSSLFSESDMTLEEYTRVVVLWPMKSQSRQSFLALTSRDAPKVHDISNEDFIATPFGMRYCQGCVQVAGEVSLIPDIEQISTDLFGSTL